MSLQESSQSVGNDRIELRTNSSPDEQIGHSIELDNLSEYEGNRIEEKRYNHIRIGFLNVNGLPKLSKDPKNNNINNNIKKYNFDLFGLAETNCYWPLMATENKWHERIRYWGIKKSKSISSYNTTSIMEEIKQPGGTLTMVIESLTTSVIKWGAKDPLSRWSWVTLRGLII